MARFPRREAIDESTVGVYHCINRCVRRAYLCGNDPASGKNYDHRKVWIQQRLEFLAAQFAIDFAGFAVLSNHFHLLLRNRPDVVACWSDREVAERWWNVFPARRNPDGTPAKPRKEELQPLFARVEQLRPRLSSISWLMRCLTEQIARRANQEDGCTGRFFQGRFTSQQLLDEASILACAIYIDLNPIRARMSDTPEESLFTSAYERIQRCDTAGPKRSPLSDTEAGEAWLCPIELQPHEQSLTSRSRRRASDRGFLPLNLMQYLELLDWTGRQVRAGKPGSIPADLVPILERLQISTTLWVDLIGGFGRWFRRAVGRPPNMAKECRRRGRSWLHGVSHSRQAFA